MGNGTKEETFDPSNALAALEVKRDVCNPLELSRAFVAFDVDTAGPRARPSKVIRKLHPHQVIHLWSESFLDTQSHLGR
jgi:hypothetical protein